MFAELEPVEIEQVIGACLTHEPAGGVGELLESTPPPASFG
jgi:hypothetical protein